MANEPIPKKLTYKMLSKTLMVRDNEYSFMRQAHRELDDLYNRTVVRFNERIKHLIEKKKRDRVTIALLTRQLENK